MALVANSAVKRAKRAVRRYVRSSARSGRNVSEARATPPVPRIDPKVAIGNRLISKDYTLPNLLAVIRSLLGVMALREAGFRRVVPCRGRDDRRRHSVARCHDRFVLEGEESSHRFLEVNVEYRQDRLYHRDDRRCERGNGVEGKGSDGGGYALILRDRGERDGLMVFVR